MNVSSSINFWQKVALFAGVAVGVLVLPNFFLGTSQRTDYEDLALGEGTTRVMASVDGVRIHCSDDTDVQGCVDGYKLRSKGLPVSLWLGNSQLHSINQYEVDQKNAIEILHRKLVSDDSYLLGVTQPNANLQEHYVLLHYLSGLIPIKRLILPVVMDDTRETGLRASLLSFLQEKHTIAGLSESSLGRELLEDSFDKSALDHMQQTQTVSLNSSANDYLEGFLLEHSSNWALREQYRGAIFHLLYRMRNTVFNITPSSKRKLIPSRYDLNMRALDEIVKFCVKKNIHLIVYIAPIRNDVPVPYIKSEYEEFKSYINSLSIKGVVDVLNFEGIVPAEFWGAKDSTDLNSELEIDFMHFSAGGHILLADRISKSF